MTFRFVPLTICALLAFSPLAGHAQTTTSQRSSALWESAPERVGMSPERLARIDTMIETAIAENRIPGAVALVARKGGIVHYRAYGMADHEAGRVMQLDDIFRIASQTKAITSTAVMMLWEQGLFQLDDPIANWIPEFKEMGVLKTFNEADVTWTTEPANRSITIRHLLTHTSGIGYGVIDGDARFRQIYAKAGVIDLFTTEPVTIADNVKKLAILPLHHHPGERYTYSEGLDVLGYFIEIISGKPFDVFLRDHLFEPLGMNDTAFYLPPEKAARLVSLQQPRDGTWVRYPVTYYDPDYPIKGSRTFFSGGAGLSSTAKDYANFLQMYLNGGELNGIRILSRTTIDTIMRNQTGDRFGGGNKHHGLAFGVLTEQGVGRGGEGSAGTFDWGGYFNTQYFADPQENIVGVLLKQTQNANDNTAWKFRQIVGAAVDD
jgi:CubicO group peptidase (beta-lactamase class C family)